MKRNGSILCAGLLILALLSGCGGRGSLSQPQGRGSFAETGSTAAGPSTEAGSLPEAGSSRETEMVTEAGSSKTEMIQDTTPAAAANAAGTGQESIPRAAESSETSEAGKSLEEVFRSHDSFSDNLSRWNAKAEPKRRSSWYSDLSPEEEQAIIDSMNLSFRQAVLAEAYRQLETADRWDERSFLLAALLEHDAISREKADDYLLARALYATNLSDQLWRDIEDTIEKIRRENPDILPPQETFEEDYVTDEEDYVSSAMASPQSALFTESASVPTGSRSTVDAAQMGPESAAGEEQADFSDLSPSPSEVTSYQDTFNTAEYKTIRENPFRSVTASPLSTFSVDVDTAGYTELKYDILDGQAIEKDAVKIEELINYFNYDYTADRVQDEPFIVSTQYTQCPWNRDHQLVRIGIRADDIQEKPDTNFVLVADVSGSMMELNRLPLALSAYADMVDGFDENDTISLMYYASGNGIVLENVKCSEKEKIYDGLARVLMMAGGGTNGALGLNTAYDLAEKSFVENGVNRVMIATDGDFNIGATSEGQLKEIAVSGKEKGIYLTILGYGSENLKDNKMEVMAENGNGNYHYIGDMTDAQKALVQESSSTLIPMANDVKIQVEFNPALVQEYRLIGYESRILNAEDFNNDRIDAGDVGAGKTVTALYEIVPANSGAETDTPSLKYSKTEFSGETSELCNVSIRYKNIVKSKTEAESQLIQKPVRVEDYQEIPDDNTALAISLAEAGMVLRDSEFKGTATLSSALAVAEAAAADTGSPLVSSWAELVKTLIEQSE